MSYDADYEDDYETDYEQQNFYRGYVSPADEWRVEHQSLFNELNGSIFDATAKLSNRLKRLNEVIAFAESRDTRKVNKKSRIAEAYNFLKQFIPEQLFDKITETLAFTSRDKKKIARDLGLNLDTLANILSLWQLELYSTGCFVVEETLEEINEYLKESSSFGTLKRRGHITTKDVERGESRILRQLFEQVQVSSADQSATEPQVQPSAIPSRVLGYYQDFIANIDQYVNDRQRTYLEKTGTLPFHMYLLLQKIAIMKKILPKLSLDYFKTFLDLADLEQLATVLDTYYADKPAMTGELIAQAIVLLEQYLGKEAMVPATAPQKFFTRLRKYRLEFGPAFSSVISEVKSQIGSEQATTDAEASELATAIHQQITALTDLTAKGLQVDTVLNMDDLVDPEPEVVEDYSFSPEEEIKITRLLTQYQFVQQQVGMSKEIWEQLIKTMVAYNITQYKRKSINGINITTMAIIIAMWQLYGYAKGTYFDDQVLEPLYRYMRKERLQKDAKTNLSTYDIETKGMGRILKKLYEQSGLNRDNSFHLYS